MATVSGTLTAEGATAELALKPGQSATYSVTGTFTGLPYLQRKQRTGTYPTVAGGTADTGFTGTVTNETKREEAYRINLLDTDSETPVTGTLTYSIADAVDTFDSVIYDDMTVLDYTDAGISVPGNADVGGDLGVTGDANITGDVNGSAAAVFVTSVIPASAVAVASLPATPVLGMIAQVNDATTPAVGSTVADGGAAAALVWYNGTNWTVIGI